MNSPVPVQKRILILSASAGQGHVRAAQALESVFRADYPGCEIRCEDALNYTSPAFRTIYSKTYVRMVNTTPGMLGLLYDYADVPWRQEASRLAFDTVNALPLLQMINKFQPGLVVCTHFMPAEIISALICRGRLSTRLAVVVTDIDVHAYWLCHHYSNYFVAGDEARAHLGELGFDRNRVTVSGIPVDPVFQVRKDKKAMRQAYGLDPERQTIYLSAGGFGVGPTDDMILALDKMQTPVQLLAMCGRNEKMFERVIAVSSKLRSDTQLRVVPVAYTTKVDEYMACADVVLGKPGGLTTAEALCRQLVFAIVNPIPGQEERNSDHLLEAGAAIRCNNLPTLAYKLDALLQDQDKLKKMQENVLALARPYAANQIVRCMLSANDAELSVTDAAHVCRRTRFRRLGTRLRPVAKIV